MSSLTLLLLSSHRFSDPGHVCPCLDRHVFHSVSPRTVFHAFHLSLPSTVSRFPCFCPHPDFCVLPQDEPCFANADSHLSCLSFPFSAASLHASSSPLRGVVVPRACVAAPLYEHSSIQSAVLSLTLPTRVLDTAVAKCVCVCVCVREIPESSCQQATQSVQLFSPRYILPTHSLTQCVMCVLQKKYDL